MMTTVESSVIEAVEYFEDEQVLEIYFLSGNSYVYFDVDPKLYEEFIGAESKGKFYNKAIKGFFDSAKSNY